MHRIVLIAAIIGSTVALGGCVINVSADEDGRRGWGAESRELRNRDAISHLQLGTPIEAVRAQLGEPDFSEAWLEQGDEVRVLRYRTHRSHADGDTTTDETTPLLFKAGKLAAIGERGTAGTRGG
jgi:hypothetical protein